MEKAASIKADGVELRYTEIIGSYIICIIKNTIDVRQMLSSYVVFWNSN